MVDKNRMDDAQIAFIFLFSDIEKALGPVLIIYV